MSKGAGMASQRFPWTRTFILGFGFFGISIVWPLFNSFVPPMLQDLKLPVVVIAFIMVWDNLINMFLQPWVGAQSDRTHSRFGRRKPWLMAGAPLAALFFILLPIVRQNFILIGLIILATDLAMALFRSPTIAYLGDLFAPQQRSKANGVINLMGGLGGAAALFGGGALYRLGVPVPFIVGAGVLLIAILIVVLYVREPETEAPETAADGGVLANLRGVMGSTDKSGLFLLAAIFCWFMGWNAMETFFTLYAQNVLGLDPGRGAQMLTFFAGMLIVFAIPSGLIATRVGRKPTILVGLVGMLAGLALGFTLRNAAVLRIVLLVMGGFWALVNINSLPMVYDLGEQRTIGAYTGLYYFSSSAAAIFGPLLAGGLVQALGNNYVVIWLFSAVFMALAVGAMLKVRPRAAATAEPLPA
jgi:maltose/moltooligosaccharide transporter